MAPHRKPGRPGEDALLEWLIRDWRGPGKATRGDDAAKLRLRGNYAFTMDTQEEGRHVPAGLDPALLARRLLAVNLSDLAASAAQPKFALLSLAVPPSFDSRRFLQAFGRAAARAGVDVVGGDLAASDHWRAVLLVAGERPTASRWLSRAAGRPDDVLWLAGPVGESAAGARLVAAGARMDARGHVSLTKAWRRRDPEDCDAARRVVRRHLAPQAQVALGLALGRLRRCAAIDLSDGLALDLHRLCRRSKTGAVLDAASIPLSENLRRVEPTAALDLALSGGEDYVLLFALPMGVTPPRLRGVHFHAVGQLTSGREVRLRHGDGRIEPLPPAGFEHQL